MMAVRACPLELNPLAIAWRASHVLTLRRSKLL